MRFLKSKVFWLTLYAIAVTFVFLYLLFPSRLVLQQLEASAADSGLEVTAGALRPSIPLGIKLKDLTVHPSQMPADMLFQGELLDLQLGPLNFLRKRKTVRFGGRAYGGDFEGSASFQLPAQTKLPAEGKIAFQNIDLGRCNQMAIRLLKGMTGHVRGSASYTGNDSAGPGPSGKLSLYLSRGAYPLPEPFLGVKHIEFDRGEIQAQLKNGSVKLSKLEIYGAQMNCFLNGDIQIAGRIDESRLNLKGVLEIAGKNKIKMNVTVGGTLASPLFRYI